jgi:E3 ubiquitin-protein ligase TRIP12
MVRSGLIDGLHDFAIGDSDLLPTEIRRNLLTDAFMRDRGNDAKTALTALVRKLQETLSRLEDVEIMTTIYNEEDARRSPTANVARQVRLKLVGESDRDGQEIPRSCNNIVVSIHAITSFRSLHDYLRPKIAASLALSGSSMSSSMPRSISGLSGMLETLASSAGIEMSAALREHLRVAAGGGAGEASTQQLTATAETSSGAKDDGKKSALTTTNNNRRRSSRLSVKAGEGAEPVDTEAESSETAPSAQQGSSMGDGEIDAALARRLVEGMLEEDLDDLEGNEVFSDDYDDGFVMDEDHMDGLGGPGVGTAGDETISLEVTTDEKKSAGESDLDASKLSQSAPNTLPSHSIKATKDEGGSASGSSTGKGTYASALRKPPVDWHVQFEMDGQKMGLDSTIYSAIHRHEMRLRSQPDQAHLASRPSWTSSYTVKFRKVPGPEPKSAEDDMSANDEIDRLRTPDMADSDTPYTRILQLLRVFYNLNREWREQSSNDFGSGGSQPLNENAFVNNKLTAKLNRQLEEPMIVASKCLPSWALILPRRFPFLFPFEARFAFLQSTSFGYHRLISRWQMRQTRDQQAGGAASNARNDGSLALLGRLTRQKVRISRSNILASATKVFELYGANSSLLEVEYFDEVGTGLGPTLEFYAMVSKDFAKKSTNMWRVDESRDSEKNEYVSTANGLFPAPIDHLELDSSAGKSRVQLFRILGQFVAKAQFDSRIIDLNFSSLFMRAVLGLGIPCTLDMLRHVDEALARSLDKLRAMSTDELDGLMLDFTMPGYAAYELHARGKDEAVTSANVEQYIDEVVTHTLQTGIRPFVEAFQKGFDLIFPISAMHAFTPEELVMLFGNQEEDWDEKTLMASIKPDHGYNADSPTFRNVISVMSTFTKTERRDFLQWLTGSPKLPVGGFMGLHPQLTIVKRPPDVNQSADQTLPSVMTCVNFCKMPPFSTRDVMRQRLLLAMREGQASFHLS